MSYARQIGNFSTQKCQQHKMHVLFLCRKSDKCLPLIVSDLQVEVMNDKESTYWRHRWPCSRHRRWWEEWVGVVERAWGRSWSCWCLRIGPCWCLSTHHLQCNTQCDSYSNTEDAKWRVTVTVFDLISGLFAYVIFGKKNALISEPPWIFFFFG